MTVFSCCYHSSLSSVHIWRLSSSQERCSLHQIANCRAGSVGVCIYYVVEVWEQPYCVMDLGTMDKSLQKKLRVTGSQMFSCKFRHFYFRCSILIDNITKVEDIMELGVAAFLCSVSSFLCWVLPDRANTEMDRKTSSFISSLNCSCGTHSYLLQWPWMDAAMTWAALGGSVNVDTDTQKGRDSSHTTALLLYALWEEVCEHSALLAGTL